jgi:hypothetical protein
VKKDALAAITFLVTGLLFFAAQVGERVDERSSSPFGDCSAPETVWVEATEPQAEAPVILETPKTRDS